MSGVFLYFRKKFHTNSSGQGISLTAKDPYWNLVGLLLRSKTGAANAQTNNTFVDSSTNNFTVTRNGNVTQGSLSPYGSLGGSMYFDGSGDYLGLPVGANGLQLGSNNFTFESWVYVVSHSGSRHICALNTTVNGAYAIGVRIDSSGKFGMCASTDAVGWAFSGPGNAGFGIATPPATWNHVAVVRQGSTFNLYVNGELQQTATVSGSLMTTYTTNQIGGYNLTQYLNGYLADTRLINGTALYTANFTPPTVPLTAIANTQLLLAANANIVDISSKSNFETVGSAQTSTTVTKINTTSMKFNGSTDWLLQPQFNVADFFNQHSYTIEGWIYSTNNAVPRAVFGTYDAGSATGKGVGLSWWGTSKLGFAAYAFNSGGSPIVQSTTTLATNTWYHVAIVKQGTTHKLFVNGILEATANASYTVLAGGPMVIGADNYDKVARAWTGYLDELRFTKGVARYLNNFTPSVVNLPYQLATIAGDQYYNNVALHLHFDSTHNSAVFADQKGHQFSTGGAPVISTTSSRFGGSSLYLNGTSYIETVANNDWAFGTGDFTVECWFSPTAWSATMGWLMSQWVSPYPLTLELNNTNIAAGAYLSGSISAAHGLTLDGSWHHVAYVRKNGYAKLFLDGVQKGSTTAHAASLTATAFGFGRKIDSEYYTGYIDEARITNGVARYWDTFTPAADAFPDYQDFNTDQYLKQSSLLKSSTALAPQHTVFVDSSTNNLQVTRNGDTAHSRFSPFSNVGFSSNFNADYVKSATGDCELVGDFTIEAWINPTAWGSYQRIISGGGAGTNYWTVGLSTTWHAFPEINFYDGTDYFSGSIPAVIGRWQHIAVVKSGTTVSYYLDGTRYATTSHSTTIGTSTGGFVVGARSNAGGFIEPFSGSICNVRVVSGIAIYMGSSFTVPTTGLTSVAGTKLLTCNSYQFMDAAGGLARFTSVGAPKIQAFSPFSTVTYVPAVHGGSMYFDGTGDYLTIPSSTTMNMGTGDFTVDAWIYWASTANIYSRIICGAGGFTGNQSYFGVYSSMGSKLYFGNSSHDATFGSPNAIPLNVWTHVAVTRSGTTKRMFVNGVVVASETDASVYDFNGAGAGTLIGASGWDAGESARWLGNLADVRVVNGTALYTSDFVVPTAPATPVTNTQLLLSMLSASRTISINQNNTILDSSANNFAVTRNGNVAQGTFSPFSNSGFSTYFDGASYYSSVSAAFNCNTVGLNSATSTVEFWFYQTGTTSAGVWFNNYDVQVGSAGVYLGMANATTVFDGTLGAGRIPKNTWHHVAVTRSASIWEVFIDGESFGTSGSGSPDSSRTGDNTARIGTSFVGYMSNVRVSTAKLYTGNFTVPTAPLSVLASTTLLMCRTNRIKDASTNNWAWNAGTSTQVQAFSPFAPATYVPATHGGSMYFDGTGDYTATTASSNLALGVLDFTMECWICPTSLASAGISVVSGSPGATMSTNSWAMKLTQTSNNRLQFWSHAVNGFNAPVVFGTTILATNRWYHIAITRSGSTFRAFVNGVLEGSATSSANLDSNVPLYIRLGTDAHVADLYTGHISDFRLTKGTALYTANFTPPTAPATPVANTQLLLSGTNAALIDVTGKTNVETSGDAKVSTNNRKFNSSVVLDGTGDYLTLSGPDQCAFGSGDFTVEMFVRVSAIGSFMAVYDSRPNGTAGAYLHIGITTTGATLVHVSSVDRITGTNLFPINSWRHVAVSRVSGTTKLFIDGVQDGASYTDATVYVNAASRPTIAGDGFSFGTKTLNGQIEDLRITKGVGRYINNFTVPLMSLPVA